MIKATLQTAPAEQPVTRAEAKVHLGIPTAETGHDSYVDALIEAATNICEQITNRRFVTQTWKVFFDRFPYCREFELLYPKLQSVTHIKYYDENGDLQTLDSAVYQTDATGIVGVVALNEGEDWPDTKAEKLGAVEIQFVCGYGNAAAVPKAIKQAILMLVGTWYENKETVVSGFVAMKVPDTIELLLASYRVYSFA